MNEEQMIEALLMLNDDIVKHKERIKTLEKTVKDQTDSIDTIIAMLNNIQ